MTDFKEVSLVRNAITNPTEPRHYMTLEVINAPVSVWHKETHLAKSTSALKLKEVAYSIYDPVVYFPREDVNMETLKKNTLTTHCPLKGDTEYFDLINGGQDNIAWSYDKPIPRAEQLKDYIAFDSRFVTLKQEN